jgi:hypothetical protein
MVGVYHTASILNARLGVRANDASPTDQSPILQVVTWLLLAIATLLLGFRQLTRFYIKVGKPFGWDDGLIIISYVRLVFFSLPYEPKRYSVQLRKLRLECLSVVRYWGKPHGSIARGQGDRKRNARYLESRVDSSGEG